MEELTEGRIVHYVMPSGIHRPAIVVQVWRYSDGKPPENGCSNLVVFVDGLNDVKRSFEDPNKDVVTSLWETSICYSENKEVGTWHWIEREL